MTPDILTHIIKRKYACCLYCVHSDLLAYSKTCGACFDSYDEVVIRANFELDMEMYTKYFGDAA